MRSMPAIDHIRIIIDGRWVRRKIPPIFRDKLAWAKDVDCPRCCPYENYPHPLLPSEENENILHRLCTLTVVGTGLVARAEIMGSDR